MNEPKFDYTIQDEADYPNQVPTMKDVTMLHIKKISQLCCQELTDGYWERKPFKTSGGVIFSEEYHPDLKEAYINAVDFLVDIVYPESNKDFKKLVDEELDKETELGINARLKLRKKLFREMNKMFDQTRYFNTLTGRTHTSS